MALSLRPSILVLNVQENVTICRIGCRIVNIQFQILQINLGLLLYTIVDILSRILIPRLLCVFSLFSSFIIILCLCGRWLQ